MPVVGAIHANEALTNTNTGIYKNETCPKNKPNHAIVSYFRIFNKHLK